MIGIRCRQGGISLSALLGALVIFAVVALGVMRILPVYLEHFAVRSSLQGVLNDPDSRTMSPLQLRKAVGSHFNVNNVRHLSPEDLKIRRDRNQTLIQADYEIRRPLVANLDIVAHFDETVVIDSR